MEKIRLDKFLSNMGLGSRSDVKKLIKLNKITVNNQVEKNSSRIIDLSKDKVFFEKKEIVYVKNIYIMMNKPSGVVSAVVDNLHKTVIDLLDKKYSNYNLFPVGRLDIDTEGLLLITSDGAFAHNLLSPKKHISKTYYVEVDKIINEDDVEKFHKGIVLDDGYKTMPAILKVLECDEQLNISKVEVTIYEGKFHQIKRMFADVKAKVIYLKRIKMGNLGLDNLLNKGDYRELTSEELKFLNKKDK